MTDRVSVILPTYNRADLIGETIDSLLNQTRSIDEIVVVDDGSSDNTPAVVAAYEGRVRYLTKPNGGKSSALNLGLSQTSGDLVWICDDDDIVLETACEALLAAFAAEPELGYCAGRHLDFTVDDQSGQKHIKPPGYMRDSKPDELFPDLLDGCHIFQPGLLVRRSVYEQVGPFDETLTRSQDYEMLLRVARAARGRLLEEVVFHHREHPGERGSAKERFSIADANAKWIRFHRLIMQPLVPDLRDEELLPDHIWNDPGRVNSRVRTAALKRASVYARNQLWPEAVATWSDISQTYQGDLDPLERDLVVSATHYSLGCDGLLQDQQVREGVLNLKAEGAVGRQLSRLLGRSLHWRVKAALKAGNFAEAWTLLKFISAAR